MKRLTDCIKWGKVKPMETYNIGDRVRILNSAYDTVNLPFCGLLGVIVNVCVLGEYVSYDVSLDEVIEGLSVDPIFYPGELELA